MYKTLTATELTENQLRAANHYEGPALVIAGPGAGKTFVITERVRYLIKERGIDPYNILVTTFTEKAADELKVKLARTIGPDAELMHISTMHSFCKTMLERYFLFHEFGAEINVLDDEGQTLLIQLNKAKFGLARWEKGRLNDIKKRFDFVDDIKKLYNQMTQNMIRPNDLITELKDKNGLEAEDEVIIRSYEKYVALMRSEKRMDFSMLEAAFLDLIDSHPDVLDEIRERFRFLLIDEYQDTSPIQNMIFGKISGKYHNIFVVGDENQSIYAFRGASIENFMRFISKHENAQSYFLDTNFRSTETIVNFSNNVFEDEVRKVLKAKRRKGEQFKLVRGETSDDTARELVSLLKRLKERGIIEEYGDVALLFRSLKYHSPEFIKYLTREGIPFVTFGDGKFLERDEIRTALCLMSYVTQVLYLEECFKKWDNWWKKDTFLSDFFAFSDSTKEVIRTATFNLYDLREEEDFISNGFRDMDDIRTLQNINRLKLEVEREKESFGDLQEGKNSLLIIFYKLLEYSGYFKRLMNRGDTESKEILHNLGKLSEIISKYMELSKKEDVKGFLWYIYSISERIDQHKIEDEHTVKLMTVHQAKGLEFPVVVLCCLNEGRFPIKFSDTSMIKIPPKLLNKDKCFDEKKFFYQEERRLFYVGVTRAEDVLIFTSSESHICQPFKESRFLETVMGEITTEELRLPIEKKYSPHRRVPSLSYSAINMFIDCPLKYSLVYDYGFVTPPSFMQSLGAFIHNVLQRIHEHMQNGADVTPDEINRIIDIYWIDLPIKKARNEKVRQKLAEDFTQYYLFAKDRYEKILAIEEPFTRIDENMIIKGKVDLIAKDKDGNIDLIDFKAREQKGIEETNVDKQLQIYRYCLDRDYGITRMYAHTFQDNKRTPFAYDKDYISGFLTDISAKMHKEDFHKQENALCRECQFKSYCWGN